MGLALEIPGLLSSSPSSYRAALDSPRSFLHSYMVYRQDVQLSCILWHWRIERNADAERLYPSKPESKRFNIPPFEFFVRSVDGTILELAAVDLENQFLFGGRFIGIIVLGHLRVFVCVCPCWYWDTKSNNGLFFRDSYIHNPAGQL